MCRQRLARAGREQLSQRTGRRSLLVAALLPLLNRGAVFTALPACLPPRHRTCLILHLALNVPCHPPVPCALGWGPGCRLGWGSWGGRPWLPAPPSSLPGEEGHGGATHGSGISCAETMSGRFAQSRGEASL